MRVARYEEARTSFDKAVSLGGANAYMAYFNRAVAEEKAGNVASAYQDYKQAVALAPDYQPRKSRTCTLSRPWHGPAAKVGNFPRRGLPLGKPKDQGATAGRLYRPWLLFFRNFAAARAPRTGDDDILVRCAAGTLLRIYRTESGLDMYRVRPGSIEQRRGQAVVCQLLFDAQPALRDLTPTRLIPPAAHNQSRLAVIQFRHDDGVEQARGDASCKGAAQRGQYRQAGPQRIAGRGMRIVRQGCPGTGRRSGGAPDARTGAGVWRRLGALG